MIFGRLATAKSSGGVLSLTCFEARISFIDDVESSFTADDLAVSVAVFEGFQGGADFHGDILGEGLFVVKNNFGNFGGLLALFKGTRLHNRRALYDDGCKTSRA